MSDNNNVEAPSAEAAQLESAPFLGRRFSSSELVIGLVGAVGTDLQQVASILKERLKAFQYDVEEIRVSTDIIPQLVLAPVSFADEYARIDALMTAGDNARRAAIDNSVLALGVAARISSKREQDEQSKPYRPRCAYIVNSLKHPDEVVRLREIYPEGFYLFGVFSDEARRRWHLTERVRVSEYQANQLMSRDEHEQIPHGQRTRDTFHLSDFFVRIDEDLDKARNSIWRILDILFGNPYKTPIFDESAMFMAFAASLRSADLSRQVGARRQEHW